MPESPEHPKSPPIALPRFAALAPTLVAILDACDRDAAAPAGALVAPVERDPALALAVLVAAAPRASTPLRTLADALASLDRPTVRSLVVALAADAASLGASSLAAQAAAWRGSVVTALAARALAERVRYAEPEEAYLAGLLEGLEGARVGQGAGGSAEEPLAEVIESLALGTFLDDALRYRDAAFPELADAHPLVRIVALARRAGDRSKKQAVEGAVGLFGLEAAAIEGVFARARREALAFAADFGIDEDLSELEAARASLARRLADLALMSALRADVLVSEDSGAAVQRAVRQITGLRRSALFLIDPAARRLQGQGASGVAKPVAELSCELDPIRSLLAAALEEGRPRHSLDPDRVALSVVDRQLLRLLDASALIALPIVDRDGPVGVVVGGLEPGSLPTIAARQETALRWLAETAHLLRPAQAPRQIPAGSEAPAARSDPKAAPTQLRKLVHEINNPLSVVRNYVAVLDQKLGAHHPARSDLEVIGEELARAVALLQRLAEGGLGDVRRARRPCDLNRLLGDLVRVVVPAVDGEDGIALRLDLDASLPLIRTDADAVRQVLLNLLRNAVEAMPAGGALTVRTRDWFKVDGTPGVEFQIADTGPGLPEALRHGPHAAPFTTKGKGHAGVGLKVVRQLVEELSGSLRFETGAEGTTFSVLLPRDALASDEGARDADARTTTKEEAREVR